MSQVNTRNRSFDQLTFPLELARRLIDGYSSRKKKGHLASFQAKKWVASDVICALSQLVKFNLSAVILRNGNWKMSGRRDLPESMALCIIWRQECGQTQRTVADAVAISVLANSVYSLPARHRAAQGKLADEHRDWMQSVWSLALFTDESDECCFRQTCFGVARNGNLKENLIFVQERSH
ncbi:hypothetical protein TNCV_371681 [Trichonephila clavipes]|nr:hypothetical protein TNCV_371681 [Trichonephila clavipes]